MKVKIKKTTGIEVVKFMLEETGIPFEFSKGIIAIPNIEKPIISMNISLFKDDNDLLIAIALQIIAKYIRILQDKHESECRQISAYDIEIAGYKEKMKKLKNSVTVYTTFKG